MRRASRSRSSGVISAASSASAFCVRDWSRPSASRSAARASLSRSTSNGSARSASATSMRACRAARRSGIQTRRCFWNSRRINSRHGPFAADGSGASIARSARSTRQARATNAEASIRFSVSETSTSQRSQSGGAATGVFMAWTPATPAHRSTRRRPARSRPAAATAPDRP